jgi:hypothetical protein
MPPSMATRGIDDMPAADSIPLLDLLQGVQDPAARVVCENMLKQVSFCSGVQHSKLSEGCD